MPKQIPTIGDPNWGIPLNAHLAQLQNPTNGGINSFEQFSQRPTNLTLDDIGKTYIYTQTGNLHQWTGTTWKVLNESVVNVKDYGAIGDGIVDDSGAVAIAIYQFQNSNPNPSYGSGKIIHFPEGIFLVNMLISFNTSKISGCGVNSTFIKSFKSNDYAISLDYNDAWSKVVIEDICFIGDSGLTRGGIRFGRDDITQLISGTHPQVEIGGLNLKNCNFKDLNIAIYKPWGNIGNHFSDCSFYKCNYHIFVLGYVDNGDYNGRYTEHAGDDNINDCHFQRAQICSIYFDGKRTPSTGNYVFTGCTFEGNPGITIYMTSFANKGSFSGGLLFEHVWFEEGTKDLIPRTINGVAYTPTVLVAIDTNVNFENTNTINCNLTRSNLFYNNCSDLVGVNCFIEKDSRSSVVVSNLRLTTGEYYDKNPIIPNNNYFTRDFIYEQAPTYENHTVVTRTKPRSVISQRSQNVLGSETFADRVSYNFDGQLGTVNTQTPNFVVKDGLLFDRCLEISNLPNGVGWLDNDILLNIANGKYILWTLDAKIVNGESFSFALASYNGRRFSENVNVTSKTWVSYLGVGYISTDAQLTSLEIKQVVGTVSRISAFQCLAFDNLQDMMDYAESGIYSSKQNIRNSISEAAPLVGSYTKGDLIYNTNPTPGGYVGWICTASGTPGTWKEFGLIAV